MTSVDQQTGDAYLVESRRQLTTCADTIRHCVNQLDDAQVWWRPNERMNSIGNLLLHLTGNISQRMLSLIGGEPDARNRDQEFAERQAISKTQLLAAFDEVIRRTDAMLASLPTERLLETRRYRMLVGEVEGTLVRLILQTLVHLGGHTQEIVAFTRLQLGDRYQFQKSATTSAQRK